MRPFPWTIAALAIANVTFGWRLGYHAVAPYFAFWALCGLLAWTAWNVASRASVVTTPLDGWIRASLVAFAIVVVIGLVLGGLGLVTLGAYLAVHTLLLGASRLLPKRPFRSESGTRSAMAVPLAIGVALLTVGVAFGVVNAPMTLYDSLSYHLFFPARWLQDHGISIIPTPFSDEAQAYAPGNGELYFLWLMLPFHGDLLARFGQFPFGLLAVVTLYAIGRRLGAPADQAVYPPTFLLLSRPVFEQMLGSNVDLVCASMFLVALYLGIVAADRDHSSDWIFWGIALGLYLGSKYLALVYTPVFIFLAVARGVRPRALWALPGIAALALPWYVRNWVVAGSPIYPASLSVGGLTIAQGAFNRTAMLNTVFHTDNLRLFPAMLAHGIGPTLVLFWVPFALVGAVAMTRRGWWPHLFLVTVPLIMAPLYWFGFPVNIDSRFLMPALAPALLPLAFVFKKNGVWNAVVHGVYLTGIVWILIGVNAALPASLPWYMNGWLALNGLLSRSFVPWFAVLALLIGLARWWDANRSRWGFPLTAALCVASAVILAIGAEEWCRPFQCEYLQTTSPYIRANLTYSWRWLSDNIERSTVAYTGINLPYPLTGNHLTNRVVYVNTDGRLHWRFHDYDRAYRSGRFAPRPPALATSSGELMPLIVREGPREDALRPRYERMEGFREAWMYNLQTEGVTHLFIAALSAYEIDYVWHDERGFPIEEDWASSDPQDFRLLYENSQVRIYAFEAHGRNRT